MNKKKIKKFAILFFWFIIVIIYPSLISIYVTIPLFIGFSGLSFITGLEKNQKSFIFLSLLYMIFLEINLSLPFMLLPISTLIFYLFLYKKLDIIKKCTLCIRIITVISINFIYFILLSINDLLTNQSSITFNKHLLLSIITDIIAAVVV